MSVFQQYNISPWLTPVRLVATSNQTGSYFNGTLNNGVGATFTYATGALTIDSVAVNIGDRVLLQAQSAANQNGIYVCTQAGATGVAAVLQRSADMQCIEQVHTGFYATVAAGTVNAGSAFVIVEPKPAVLGVSNFVWSASPLNSGLGTAAAKAASNNSLSTLASTAGSGFTAGHIVTAADTAGTISDSGFFIRAQKATYAGGSATATITDTSITTASVVVLNIQASTTAVSVQKVTAGAGSITVLMSGDPGAGTIFDYIATSAQV